MKLRTQRKFEPLKYYGFLPDTPLLMTSLLMRGFTVTYATNEFREVGQRQAITQAADALSKTHALRIENYSDRVAVKIIGVLN
jgi:hypothetical protein